ncbi:hypothetical protein [Clostridium sp.]|uniref:hypothetical protein n=1 Tax=Clostridium sp. TaxID=1506 RepID=UPI002FC72148
MKAKYFYIILLPFIIFFQSTEIVFATDHHIPMTWEEKLKLLEPSEAKTIYDYELLRDRDTSNFKEETFPISLIQKEGTTIPFKTIHKDLNWQRPIYSPLWHSSSWRWSYVPLNMAYQRHIVYAYQGGLSWLYDLSNYLALPTEATGASPLHDYAFTIKYPYIVRLIVFNFNVSSIKHYKNQIIVSGEPLRTGLTVIDFNTKDLCDSKKLLQLATPDGYELDYLVLYLNNN